METETDWSRLRSLPVRYSEWGGNLHPDGADAPIATNGYMIFTAEGADPDRYERLAGEEHPTRTSTADTVEETWELVVADRKHDTHEAAELDGVRRLERNGPDTQIARLTGKWGETRVNAQYLRILQLAVNFDELRAEDPKRAVLAYRDGEPVGALMPRRAVGEWQDMLEVEL